jgi:hypothetical protein
MIKEELTVHQVVEKLIGPIKPAGVTHIDDKRFENLEAMIDLTEALLDDLHRVSFHSERHEASVAKAGKKAKTFLKNIIEEYGEIKDD